MKKLVPGIFLMLLALQLNSQTVTSTCQAPDSVYRPYMRDADRLALRRVFHINSTFKDSIELLTPLRSTYKAALLAVFNANLTARDTVVRLLQIHTKPDYELNTIMVKANPASSWMMNLQNSTLPTGYGPIDDLIYKHNLFPLTYYQASQYDVAVFKSDTSLNMHALSTAFEAVSGVIGAEPGSSYNDTRDITDSIGQGFTILTYSYGWGTCENGCDHRSYWSFKVYPNCSVEYKGHSGDAMPLGQLAGVQENSAVFEGTLLYPNPAGGKITIKQTGTGTVDLEIMNTLGQTLLQSQLTSQVQETDLSALPAGIYYARLRNGQGSRSFKLVKE